jgi:hypothetical protein
MQDKIPTSPPTTGDYAMTVDYEKAALDATSTGESVDQIRLTQAFRNLQQAGKEAQKECTRLANEYNTACRHRNALQAKFEKAKKGDDSALEGFWPPQRPHLDLAKWPWQSLCGGDWPFVWSITS